MASLINSTAAGIIVSADLSLRYSECWKNGEQLAATTERFIIRAVRMQIGSLLECRLQIGSLLECRLQIGSLLECRLQIGSLLECRLQIGSLLECRLQIGSLLECRLQIGSLWECRLQIGSLLECRLQIGSLLECRLQIGSLLECRLQIGSLLECRLQIGSLWECRLQIGSLLECRLQIGSLLECRLQIGSLLECRLQIGSLLECRLQIGSLSPYSVGCLLCSSLLETRDSKQNVLSVNLFLCVFSSAVHDFCGGEILADLTPLQSVHCISGVGYAHACMEDGDSVKYAFELNVCMTLVSLWTPEVRMCWMYTVICLCRWTHLVLEAGAGER